MKVRGSTLVESLIALTILVTVLGISMNSLVSVSRTSDSDLETEALARMDVLLTDMASQNSIKSFSKEINSIYYSANISLVNRYDGVLRVDLTAEINDKKLASRTVFLPSKK